MFITQNINIMKVCNYHLSYSFNINKVKRKIYVGLQVQWLSLLGAITHIHTFWLSFIKTIQYPSSSKIWIKI